MSFKNKYPLVGRLKEEEVKCRCALGLVYRSLQVPILNTFQPALDRGV